MCTRSRSFSSSRPQKSDSGTSGEKKCNFTNGKGKHTRSRSVGHLRASAGTCGTELGQMTKSKSLCRKRKLSQPQTSSSGDGKFKKLDKKRPISREKTSKNVAENGESSKKSKTENCKKRGQSNVTTRSHCAKAVKVDGERRFVLDQVCDCSEDEKFTLNFLNGSHIRSCKCGKLLTQFLKLTDCSNVDEPDLRESKDDMFCKLSIEMMCCVFKYLSLKELLRMELMSKKIQSAVHATLKLITHIDFMEDISDHRLFEDGLHKLTNRALMRLIAKLPRLKNMYNFHPAGLKNSSELYRSSSCPDELSVDGIVTALMSSKTLDGIEISNLELFEVITRDAPHLKILGRFANREKCFPTMCSRSIELTEESRVTNIHLVGCSVSQLPPMDTHLEHLYLRYLVNMVFNDKDETASV